MPAAYLEESEVEGFDWQNYYLEIEEVTPARSRDSQGDVARAAEEIGKNVGWCALGEEGKRIQRVLAGADDEWEAFEAWEKHLRKRLKFPFKAEVSEHQDRGRIRVGDKVTVLSMTDLDDLYGIIVALERRGERFEFPLCDLSAMEQNSATGQAVSDYAVWFANR